MGNIVAQAQLLTGLGSGGELAEIVAQLAMTSLSLFTLTSMS